MGIVEKNYEELMSMATSVARKELGGPDRSDYTNYAADIAQNVVMMLLEKETAGELREAEMFGLAKGMARLRSITYMRDESRRRELEEEHGEAINRRLTGQSAESLAADPYEEIPLEEAAHRLDALSPLLYRTTNAYYIVGEPIESIAEMEGVSEDVIYKRLQRARDIVKDSNND